MGCRSVELGDERKTVCLDCEQRIIGKIASPAPMTSHSDGLLKIANERPP